MSKLIRPNSWITQTVRQRIPNCWACNGESTSAESAATDAWNDELTATGGSQMLATRNRGDRHAVIGEVRRGSPSQTTVDHHRQLVLHPLRMQYLVSLLQCVLFHFEQYLHKSWLVYNISNQQLAIMFSCIWDTSETPLICVLLHVETSTLPQVNFQL